MVKYRLTEDPSGGVSLDEKNLGEIKSGSRPKNRLPPVVLLGRGRKLRKGVWFTLSWVLPHLDPGLSTHS